MKALAEIVDKEEFDSRMSRGGGPRLSHGGPRKSCRSRSRKPLPRAGRQAQPEPSRPSWRKRVHPEDFLLDIAVKDGLIYTISNRRLATLRAYHSWSWDKLLFVRCNQELLNSKARIIKFCPHTIFNGSHAIVKNRLVSPSRRRKPSVRETCMPLPSPFEETIHAP